MSNTQSTRSSDGRWYVATWPPLAWLETVIKLAALVLGFIALARALSGGVFWLPGGLPAWSSGGLRLAQLIILACLSLGLVAAVFDRLAERRWWPWPLSS